MQLPGTAATWTRTFPSLRPRLDVGVADLFQRQGHFALDLEADHRDELVRGSRRQLQLAQQRLGAGDDQEPLGARDARLAERRLDRLGVDAALLGVPDWTISGPRPLIFTVTAVSLFAPSSIAVSMEESPQRHGGHRAGPWKPPPTHLHNHFFSLNSVPRWVPLHRLFGTDVRPVHRIVRHPELRLVLPIHQAGVRRGQLVEHGPHPPERARRSVTSFEVPLSGS
jgi:hypothetical protein